MTGIEPLEEPLAALKDRVAFRGHPMVRATHRTTIEITTEGRLTERGDCIVGVLAEKGCAALDGRLKDALRRTGSRVAFRLVVEGKAFAFSAAGGPGLELSDLHEMVIRKSEFLSPRTLAIGSSAAAKDIPREMVDDLRNPEARGWLEMTVV